MDDKENIKININQNPIYDDTQNIYHHIHNIKVSVNEKSIEKQKAENNIFNINKYFAAAILSVFIYVACALTAQVQLADIITIEVPLTILLSLLLTYLMLSNHVKEGYCGYTIVAILLFFVNPSYTFIVLVTELSQAIIDCTVKIFTNKHDFSVFNEEKHNLSKSDHIINFFHRIKYHLLLSVIFFVAFTLFSYFYPSVFQSLIIPAYQGMQEGVQSGTVELATTPLFINNFSVAFRMFISGICLSIPNIYLLIYNGLLIGFTGSQLPISYFLSFTVPHGILELTAVMLAGGAGFKVTQAILNLFNGLTLRKEISFSNFMVVSLKMILDSIVIMVVVFVLLMIAAYVEANLTIPIGRTLLGI